MNLYDSGADRPCESCCEREFSALFCASDSRTLHVDVDELREHERHAAERGPRHAFQHHRDDGFAQQVGQRQLPVTVVRHDVLGRHARDHHLQQQQQRRSAPSTLRPQ